MSLYKAYKDILNNNKRWNPNTQIYTKTEHDITTLFSRPKSYNFIVQLFGADCNFRSLVDDLNKYKTDIPEDRLNHTISLYLIGILIAEKMRYENFNLPKWDLDVQRNFLHSWLGICLFHDFGYVIEENKQYDVDKLQTIDNICGRFGIENDLRDVYPDGLIDNYYRYRADKGRVIDHGIVGAMMLYDCLMTRNNCMEKFSKTGEVCSEKPLFGQKNKESISRYAYTIARHNMWFSEPINVKTYKEYGLNALISKADNSHKIAFSKEPLLFLLCLIDTLEPLKIYAEKTPDAVLKTVDFDVFCSGSTITMKITDLYKSVIKKVEGCVSWLDIEVTRNSEHECNIIFK